MLFQELRNLTQTLTTTKLEEEEKYPVIQIRRYR